MFAHRKFLVLVCMGLISFDEAFHIPYRHTATGKIQRPIRDNALKLLPIDHTTTKNQITQSQQPHYRPAFHKYRVRQRRQAIHEPHSDTSTWRWPSEIFQSLRTKHQYQILSKLKLVKLSIIIGLSSYYFYKGLSSISSSVSFWKSEGDMILAPLSVATWSGELIGYVSIL
jgi:hypothetical protein